MYEHGHRVTELFVVRVVDGMVFGGSGSTNTNVGDVESGYEAEGPGNDAAE